MALAASSDLSGFQRTKGDARGDRAIRVLLLLLMTGMETDLKLIGQVGRAAISIALAGVALPFIAGVAFGQFLPDTLGSSLSILLPATGTLASRRAAEIAVTLTRSRRIPITALYVASTQPGPTGAESGRLRHVTPMAPREEAILKDVVDLADRYGVSVRTAIRIQTPPDQAILDQVKRGRHNLIVMGVNRRPGDRLFFGNVAATVLRKSKVSISFVSS